MLKLTRVAICLLVIMTASLCFGQFVQITGTVADPNGTPYTSGSGKVQLVSGNQSGPQAWTIGGTNPVNPTVPIAGLDSYGRFSIQLTNTSLIDQQSAQPEWQFQFCSNIEPGPQVCFTVQSLALTSNQDITAQISITPPPILYVPSEGIFSSIIAGNVNGQRNASQFPGSDICAKINSAIATCTGSDNCEVWVPQGSYSCTTTATLQSGVHLLCPSPNSTTITYTGSGTGVDYNGSTNAEIDGCNFAGSGSYVSVVKMNGNTVKLRHSEVSGNIANTTGKVVNITGIGGTTVSTTVRVEDSDVTTFGGLGIYVEHATNTWLTDTLVFTIPGAETTSVACQQDTGSSGLYISNLICTASLNGLVVKDSTGCGNSSCWPYGKFPNYIRANDVLVDSIEYGDGVVFDSSLSSNYLADTFVNLWNGGDGANSGGTCVNTAANGIGMYGGHGMTFTNSTVRRNCGNGFYFNGAGVGDVTIEGGIINNNNVAAQSDQHGIYLKTDACSNHVIGVRSGILQGNGDGNGIQQYGVKIASGAGCGAVISGNDLSNNNTGDYLNLDTTNYVVHNGTMSNLTPPILSSLGLGMTLNSQSDGFISPYMIANCGSSCSARYGFGLNGFWNGTNWQFNGNGGSNGGVVLLGDTGGDFLVYPVATTGGTNQTIANASLTGLGFKVSPGPMVALPYISGSTQCLHADSSGNITGTGSDCGSGGGGGLPSGNAYNILAYQAAGGTNAQSVSPIVYAGELFGISTTGDQTAAINSAAATLAGLGVPTMLKLPIGGATLVSSGVLNLQTTILVGSGTNGWNSGGLALPTSYLHLTFNSGSTPQIKCVVGGWCGAQDLVIVNDANNSVMGPVYTCGIPWLYNVRWVGMTPAGNDLNSCQANPSTECPVNDAIQFGTAGQTTTTCGNSGNSFTINSPYAGYGTKNINHLYFSNIRLAAALNEQARGIHMYDLRTDFTDANPSGYAVQLGEASGSTGGLPVNANIIEISAEQAPFGSSTHCNYQEVVGLTTFATNNAVVVNNDDVGNCVHAIQVTNSNSSANDLTVQSGFVSGSVVLDAGISSNNNTIHDNVNRVITSQTVNGANLGQTGTATSGWNFLRMNSGGVVGWLNSGGSAYDTGISRDSADVIDFGNGTAGNKSATTNATIVNAVTGFQINGAAPSGHCPVGNGTNYVDSASCGGGGGSPGGSNTQLQWNNSGSFGGIADWTTNGTTQLTGAAASIFTFGTNNTSAVNACGGYSDFWITHENQTCTNYPAASSSPTDIATAGRSAIAALVNFDTLHAPCATASFAGTLPSWPSTLIGVTVTTSDDCPLGMVYPANGPTYTITNSVENSSSVVTLTTTNAMKPGGGTVIHLSGLTTATWLNGFDVTTTSATSSTVVFTDPSSHGSSGSTSDTGTILLDAELGGALWTANDSGSTSPCIVDLSTSQNMTVSGLTLQDLGQNNYGCQLGATVAGGLTAYINGNVSNVTLVGSSDNIFIQGATASGNFYNVQAFSQWDTTKIAVTTPTLNFYNPVLYTNGASTSCDFARDSNVSAQGGVGGATHGAGIINFFEGQLVTQSCSGNTHAATNVQLTGGITVNILGGLTATSGGTQPAFLVNSVTGGHAGNFHVTSNTQYNPATLYGSSNDDSSSWFLNQNPLGSALTNVAANTTGSPGATTFFRGDNSWSLVGLPSLATQAADTVVANFTAGTAAPTAVPMPTTGTNGCAGASNALTYNTSTHSLGCNSITAGGASLDSITAAGGTNTINNGNFAQTWSWLLTGVGSHGFNFNEPSASTGGSALGQFLVTFGTASGSTAVPVKIGNTLSGSQTLPALYLTPVWNTSGVVDAGILMNVTNTASGTGSLLEDLQVGGSSVFKVDKLGNVTMTGALALGSPLAVNQGGTGTGSTLTGLMRGNASAMTAAELSGDCTTSGSNAVTCTKVNGGSFPASAVVLGTNGSSQPVAATTTGTGSTAVLSAGPTFTGSPALSTATATSLYATGIIDGKATVNVFTTNACTFGTAATNCASVNSLSGYYINEQSTANAAFTGTLPTAAAGLQYCVSNAYNGSNPTTGALEILTSASGQFIIFTDGTLSATGGFVQSGGAAGDAACVVGVDATHWMLYVNRGSWTKH